MRTSEAEVETGISKQTLYFYENEGLIEVARDSNEYRNYSNENIQTLQMIRLLRDLEVSLDDIKLFLNGGLDLQALLNLKQASISKTIETQKDILKVVSVLKDRNMPLVLPFESLGREIEKTLLGYWRTSEKVSIGRRLSRQSLARTLLMHLFGAFVFTLALMIGIPKMLKRPISLWVYGLIFLSILALMFVFFLCDLLTTGSPIPTSRFKFLEFEESGIRYYCSDSLRSNLKYVLNVLKGETEKSLEFAPYNDIVKLHIKQIKRYMGGRVAMDVKSVDFDFILKHQKHIYLMAPLILDNDSYWLAHIVLAKISDICDEDGVLEMFSRGENLNSRV